MGISFSFFVVIMASNTIFAQTIGSKRKSDGGQMLNTWIAFTTAHLASLYPNAAATYGSVNRSCRCQVLADLTLRRTTELQKWLDGAEEGEVCAGSIKRKEENEK